MSASWVRQAARLINVFMLQGLIVLFVFAGLAIVVVLPFMIAKKRGMRRAPGDGKGGFSLSNLFGGKSAHSN